MARSISLAREVAYDAFVSVMKHDRKPEEVLEELFTEHGQDLRRLDRNFIKEILYGSLRWYSKIYWILQKTSRRDLDQTTAQIQAALVCGTYQIYYMDRVADRAAVNESVEYVRSKGQATACTFVNGILRQIARRAEYFTKPDKEKQAGEYLALQFAHPRWVVDRWLKRFKNERMEKMLASNNQPPPHSIRVNLQKVAIEDVHTLQQNLLKQERTHTERRPLRVCLRCKEFPRVDTGSLFQEGFFTIQDEAAQLIGYLVAPEPGQYFVDACAAPGGKLSHVIELADGPLKVTACDDSKVRLQDARVTCDRLQHQDIQWFEGNFLTFKPETAPDKILIDAPCSGLGVLRRHPEGKWQKQPSIIPTMVSIQRQMLKHAIEIAKPGTEIIYSVCSFEDEETYDQMQWVLKTFEGKVKIQSIVSRLPDYYKKYVTRENLLLVYSGNQDDMDGFGSFVIVVQ